MSSTHLSVRDEGGQSGHGAVLNAEGSWMYLPAANTPERSSPESQCPWCGCRLLGVGRCSHRGRSGKKALGQTEGETLQRTWIDERKSRKFT